MINSIGINNFSLNANTISPFSTSGRDAVGLENVEAKADLFSPVEETPQDERALNDDDNREDRVEDEEQNGRGREQSPGADEDLSPEELDEIRELSARDIEVRAHEAAHASVGGQYAGAPSYSYQTGPNGVRYAVGGEVPISLPSSNGNPEQAVRAAEQVRRAALAPADPSGQDRRIAARATVVANEARAEIREQREADRRLAEAERSEARAESELREEQRRSRIESVRSSNFLNSNLSTPENVSGGYSPGKLLDQTA